MTHREKDLNVIKPPPPPMLNKETMGVWTGWTGRGDKEVAREAAAKGNHIELAYAFLSMRKKLLPKDTETWFKNEILIWVNELLEGKQIFRVTHILNNIKADPVAELTNIFTTTSSSDLRNYIGKHLKSQDKLNENLNNLWIFLQLIINHDKELWGYKLKIHTIESLADQTDEWKAKVSAILFLKTFDSTLETFLIPRLFWQYLFLTKNIKTLKLWINIKYEDQNGVNSNFEQNDDIHPELLRLLKEFTITKGMLDSINKEHISVDVKNDILSELSKFGIFLDEEKSDFAKLLYRLNSSGSIQNICDILKKSSSTVGIQEFIKISSEYLVDRRLLTVLSCTLNALPLDDLSQFKQSPLVNLLVDFRFLTRNRFDEDSLKRNTFNVVNYIKNDSYEEFFGTHPLILFALLFFSKNIKFLDVFTGQVDFTIDNVRLNKYFDSTLKRFSTVRAICDKLSGNMPQSSLTFYDLLEKHLGLNVKDLFSFRFNTGVDMPHFNCDSLVQNFGYKKEVDCLFQVKNSRPSIASKMFIVNQYRKHGRLDEEDVKLVNKKILKIALMNFNSVETACSCVAFSEMIGTPSDVLRIHVKAAQVLYEADYDETYIKHVFAHLDPFEVQNILENVLIENVDFTLFEKSSYFIEAMVAYGLVIRFSLVNNIKLPELFLRNCATHDLWLPFLIFSQINNYPVDLLKELLQSFKSPHLLEHVNHCVTNDIQVEEDNRWMKERDSRNCFLSRIGVRKSTDSLVQNETSGYSSVASRTSYGSGSSGSDVLEIDILNTKTTLLQTLIRCHNSTDPPRALLQACQLYRNPLLAIFSTSYEPDSLITNWLTWLAVSCELYQTFTNFESITVSASAVCNLMDKTMERKYSKTLLQSFQIFLPENPLKEFVEFLCLLIDLELEESKLCQKIVNFTALLNNLRGSIVLPNTDHEMTYLTNRTWIETTSLTLLSSALDHNLNSSYEQILILITLCQIKLCDVFTVDCPNFRNLLKVLQLLYDSGSTIRLDIGAALSVTKSREVIVTCINHLIEDKLYETAIRVAEVEGLPFDLIIIREWRNNFETRHEDELGFWENCNAAFYKYNITADCVVDFYLECYDNLTNGLEKYKVLTLSYEWAHGYDLSMQYELEQRMWLSYISLDDKYRYGVDLKIKPASFLYKDLLEMLVNVPAYEGELSKEGMGQVVKLVALALNRGNFWLALRLEKMYNSPSADLEILKLCHSLAEGLQMPYQLNTKERLLLSKVSNFRRYSSSRRTLLSTRLLSVSSSTQSHSSPLTAQNLDVDCPLQDTLAIIQTLSEKLTNGSEIAANILMMYRVSINIEIPYNIVVANPDYMRLLKNSLDDNCMNKLEVIHDFIGIYKWSKNQVADFICEELVNAASQYIKSKCDTFTMWDLNMDQDFHLVLQLLQENCSILGQKIYSYASALYKAQIISSAEFRVSELALIIELLIRAHDCFTADCNMEGISVILNKCPAIVTHLLTLRSWKLIVRLLTGVARYTEMKYVFQILKENDQFEFLLRKGSRKDNGLKMALLEYLKKYCPENRDLYKIVALHFTLFSEVALLWEREATNIVKNLIAISKLEMQNNKMNPDTQPYVVFTNTDGTRICLNKAMENYTHATEFHLQGEKLAKAMSTAKQAELLAMQLSMLKGLSNTATSICLLDLETHQISSLITNELSFEQSLILVEAYNYQPDWATIIYEQCILRNHSGYLDQFLKHLPLNDSLIHDVSRKFLTANLNSSNEINNMKHIIDRIPSVHTKYKVASELGFTDLVEDLITMGQLCFLKDTVWKRGYKS